MTHIELELRLPEGAVYRPELAYALYGMLCERMESALADALHEQAVTPIRQSVRSAAPGQLLWSLDLFAAEPELTALLQELQEIHLERLDAPLAVEQCAVSPPLTTRDLLAKSAAQPAGNRVRLFFHTPCSFKVAGSYARFPSAELIAQSLFLRWNALMSDSAMESEDALHLLCAGLELRRYRLRSREYWLKGQRLPGFIGEVELSARLAAPMQELWRLLLAFAPYSGVGIKTALGMGAVRVEPVPPRSEPVRRA